MLASGIAAMSGSCGPWPMSPAAKPAKPAPSLSRPSNPVAAGEPATRSPCRGWCSRTSWIELVDAGAHQVPQRLGVSLQALEVRAVGQVGGGHHGLLSGEPGHPHDRAREETVSNLVDTRWAGPSPRTGGALARRDLSLGSPSTEGHALQVVGGRLEVDQGLAQEIGEVGFGRGPGRVVGLGRVLVVVVQLVVARRRDETPRTAPRRRASNGWRMTGTSVPGTCSSDRPPVGSRQAELREGVDRHRRPAVRPHRQRAVGLDGLADVAAVAVDELDAAAPDAGQRPVPDVVGGAGDQRDQRRPVRAVVGGHAEDVAQVASRSTVVVRASHRAGRRCPARPRTAGCARSARTRERRACRTRPARRGSGRGRCRR